MASESITRGFRLNHTGIRVTDIQRAIDFYTKTFGMKELARMVLDTVTVGLLGYEHAEDSHLPILARQGVLELVCSKVMKSHRDQPLTCQLLIKMTRTYLTQRTLLIILPTRASSNLCLLFLIWMRL